MKHHVKPGKDDLLFLPLGGSDEIGMNLNLYGHKGKWIMVDCGITFIDELGMDVAMPDPTFLKENKKDLLGLVVTHGHEDHIGAIAHLYQYFECPIYATPFTAFLIREKLKEAGWAKVAPVIEIPTGSDFHLEGFHITYLPITHSIPEAHVLKIKTDVGVIVHTGDWKLDNTPLVGSVTDELGIKTIGKEGVLALVCDSTNIFEEGRSGSEGDVRDNLINLISKQRGRVAVACFASNVARLATCYEAAAKTGRQLVLVGRSLERMDQAARYAGYLKGTPKFLSEESAEKLPPEQVLIISTGSQGEPRSAMARMASGQHPRVKIKPGDTIIFSSRTIPGNEEKIHHMQQQLMDLGAIVITDDDDFTHVSGHPYRDELKDMYTWTKPQMLIPVHGERPHLREHAAYGLECGIPQSLAPHNGWVIKLNGEEGPEVVSKVITGRWGVDGLQLVSLNNEEVRKRGRLGNSGCAFLSIALRSNGKLAKPPHMTLLGIGREDEQQDLMEAIEDNVVHAIHNLSDKALQKEEAIADAIRKATQNTLQGMRGKKPPVIVHVDFY